MADQMTARQGLTLASWLLLWAGTYWVGQIITDAITREIDRRKGKP